MDEFDANTTPYDETGDQLPVVSGSSRRSFLKAAVVGSAAAVAVSGVGAATLTLTGRHTGLSHFVPFVGTVITGSTADACVTNSSDQSQSSFKADSIYFWAKFNDLPVDNYSADVKVDNGLHSNLVIDPQNTNYVDGLAGICFQSNANCVDVFLYDPSTATFSCNPPSIPSPGDTPYHQNTLPIAFQVTGSKQDALLEVHVIPESNHPALSITMTATLTAQGTGHTETVSATFNLTL